MNQWYLSKNGQRFGPMKQEKLVSLIQTKKVNHLDLVYKDEVSGWRALCQVKEFALYLNDKGLAPSKNASMDWVLLKEIKTKKGAKYKQMGPFTEDQVLVLLDQGKIHFSDLAWKKGFQSWLPISHLDPFRRSLPSSPNIDPDLYDGDQTKMGKNPDMSTIIRGTDLVGDFTRTAPINKEGFVTECHFDPTASLVVPEKAQFEDKKNPSPKKWAFELSDQEQTALKQIRVNKPKKPRPLRSNRNFHPRPNETSETWKWALVVGILILVLLGLYSANAVFKKSATNGSSSNQEDFIDTILENFVITGQSNSYFTEESSTPIQYEESLENENIKESHSRKPAQYRKTVYRKSKNRFHRMSLKKKSFYQQRDRKALFYSSLNAERLIREMETKSESLKGQKRIWFRFYSNWLKKVDRSLAPEIRNFPKKKETYAYPKMIERFKKDYVLFRRYGESMNAKAMGKRIPSSGISEKNIKRIFANHRRQIQALGR